ncbi:MAG TPA: hypothetical protein VLA77_01160 [Candidatus Saccharimonadales bacterium]|nr:hypothetical protein [Candidatus Saccharimonadales bacterium]
MISVEDIRQRNYREYLAQLEADPEIAPKADRADYVHADKLDAARLIAEHGGEIDDELLDFLLTQTATQTIESLGAFDSQVEIEFDGNDLISFGERESITRRRSVLAAFALKNANPEMAFYADRTLAENYNKIAENQMMYHDPIGSAKFLISPAEMENVRLSQSLGMFPGREMAIMQISWKKSANRMALRCVSLDRANLDIVGTHLKDQEMEVPEGAKAQDFISFVKDLHFENQEQMDAFVKMIVDNHDEMVLEQYGIETKQGVTANDSRNLQLSLNDLLNTDAGRLLLNRKIKMDKTISEHISQRKPLGLGLRHLAQQAMQKFKSNGKPLLNMQDRHNMTRLLAASFVSVDDEGHLSAIENLIYIHSSAAEESYRKYLAGDKKAMNWMLSEELGFSDSVDAINSGTEAIEQGRGAEACGEASSLGEDGVDPDAPLWEKYGWKDLQFGECIGCGEEDLVGPCSACNKCDAEDRRRPGDLSAKVTLRQAELRRKKAAEQRKARQNREKSARQKRKIGRKVLIGAKL